MEMCSSDVLQTHQQLLTFLVPDMLGQNCKGATAEPRTSFLRYSELLREVLLGCFVLHGVLLTQVEHPLQGSRYCPSLHP